MNSTMWESFAGGALMLGLYLLLKLIFGFVEKLRQSKSVQAENVSHEEILRAVASVHEDLKKLDNICLTLAEVEKFCDPSEPYNALKQEQKDKNLIKLLESIETLAESVKGNTLMIKTMIDAVIRSRNNNKNNT